MAVSVPQDLSTPPKNNVHQHQTSKTVLYSVINLKTQCDKQVDKMAVGNV